MRSTWSGPGVRRDASIAARATSGGKPAGTSNCSRIRCEPGVERAVDAPRDAHQAGAATLTGGLP